MQRDERPKSQSNTFKRTLKNTFTLKKGSNDQTRARIQSVLEFPTQKNQVYSKVFIESKQPFEYKVVKKPDAVLMEVDQNGKQHQNIKYELKTFLSEQYLPPLADMRFSSKNVNESWTNGY